jgi:hypothetical protein
MSPYSPLSPFESMQKPVAMSCVAVSSEGILQMSSRMDSTQAAFNCEP